MAERKPIVLINGVLNEIDGSADIPGAIRVQSETNAFGTSNIYTAFIMGLISGATAANGGLYGIGRYNKANESFVALSGWDNGSFRDLYFGGGGWNAPDAMRHTFYCAPTYTETNNTGTIEMQITSGFVDIPNRADIDNIRIENNTISSHAGTDLLITPLAGQQLIFDNTIIIDGGTAKGFTYLEALNVNINFSRFADSATSTTDSTKLYDDTIPAGSFATDGDTYKAEYWGDSSADANQKLIWVTVDGQSFYQTDYSADIGEWTYEVSLIRQNDTTLRWKLLYVDNNGTVLTKNGSITVTDLDVTAVDIELWGRAPTAGSVTAKGGLGKLTTGKV